MAEAWAVSSSALCPGKGLGRKSKPGQEDFSSSSGAGFLLRKMLGGLSIEASPQSRGGQLWGGGGLAGIGLEEASGGRLEERLRKKLGPYWEVPEPRQWSFPYRG